MVPLLCHFLLLLLPLASLQVEQSVDLLFFCLGIIEFEDVVVDGLSRSGCYSAHRRFIARDTASIDWHLARDVASSTALTRARCRQSAGDHGSRSRDYGGVIIVFYWMSEKVPVSQEQMGYRSKDNIPSLVSSL